MCWCTAVQTEWLQNPRYEHINQRDIMQYLPIVVMRRTQAASTYNSSTTRTVNLYTSSSGILLCRKRPNNLYSGSNTRSHLRVSRKNEKKKNNMKLLFLICFQGYRSLCHWLHSYHAHCEACEFDFNLHDNTNKLLAARTQFILRLRSMQ